MIAAEQQKLEAGSGLVIDCCLYQRTSLVRVRVMPVSDPATQPETFFVRIHSLRIRGERDHWQGMCFSRPIAN
jgi:hypothetical protein